MVLASRCPEECSEVREDVEEDTKMTKAVEHLTYMRNVKRWELSLEAEEDTNKNRKSNSVLH